MASTKKRDQLRALMEGIDSAMFTTLGEDGFPVSRPLSTQAAEFDGKVLWFFVRRDTPKVREIGRYAKVNVAYAKPGDAVYLSVAGTARVVDDRAKIEELWSDALKAYFKRGVGDPQLVLIEVTVHSVQYWDGPSTGLGRAIAFVAARLGADESVLGENRLLRLEEAPPRQRRAARRKAVIAGKERAARTGRAAKSSTAMRPAAKAAAKKTTARKTTAKRPAAKQAAAKKTAKRPAAKKSTVKKSTAKKRATRR